MIYAGPGRVLAKLVEIKQEKKGILIVPDKEKDYQVAQIHSSECDTELFQEGYYVYTRKYAGLLVEIAGEEYVSFKMDEILAVSEELK